MFARPSTAELLAAHPDLDAVVVPVGGGGLIGGIAAVPGQLVTCNVYTEDPADCDWAVRTWRSLPS